MAGAGKLGLNRKYAFILIPEGVKSTSHENLWMRAFQPDGRGGVRFGTLVKQE